MKNDGRHMTRKEQQREEFEEHFYATWPGYIKSMSDDELARLNSETLQDVNATWPETMLCLKQWVLQEMAERDL